jgi:hypothetical protein
MASFVSADGDLRSQVKSLPDPVSVVGPAVASAATDLRPPEITRKCLLHQFWVDVFGKEVQTTSTYSYTWMADQVGHVCLGIVIDFGLTLGARFTLPLIGIGASWDALAGLLIGSIVVSLWELLAYLSSVRVATGLFPLDRKLLRDNAVIAAGYMIIGVGSGFAFHQSAHWGVAGFVALLFLAVSLAPPWLRQKIIWQKAALPYLFRLADAKLTIRAEAARQLQALIEHGAPVGTQPAKPARQIVVGGPIGSGRTPIAAGIGTEFAFRKTKVRYLSIDTLLEFAARSSNPHFADDTGPANIEYWRWSEAQVVIIDDIGPLIAAREPEQNANLEHFRDLLDHGLAAVAPVLRRCHTVWVIGDLRPDGATAMVGDTLNRFAGVIAEFCGAEQQPSVLELLEPQARAPMVEEAQSIGTATTL